MSKSFIRHSGVTRAPAKQRGIVLIVALVVIIVMSLAGLLMYRSLNSGVEIAGNLGFKQNATSVGDLGIETGRAYLMKYVSNALPLDNDDIPNAYYSSWDQTFTPQTYDWDKTGNSVEATAADGTGNRVRYVIHRLCAVPNIATTAPNQHCAIPSNGSPLGTGGGGASGAGFSSAAGQPYYRITARVDGPRSTVSYVQVIMY